MGMEWRLPASGVRQEVREFMNQLQKNHYKEAAPIETVHRLRNILHDLGIHVIEEWNSKDGDACHALRIRIIGSDIGTNGKGATREYALASAYAEFFERMQNSILASPLKFDVQMKQEAEFIDDRLVSAEEIVRTGGTFFSSLADQMHFCHDDENLCTLQFKMSYKGCREDGMFFCRPFYSLKDQKEYLLPREIYYPYYGSNGMCAGNSMEEALVQGISEILERYVQKRILKEGISLPDIPMEYLKQFPDTYALYQSLLSRKPEGYTYVLKDASLGGRYPVAAFVAICQSSGRYGVRFGAHPDYGIAVERTLTEAFQGRDIERFAEGSILDFDDENVTGEINIYNSFKAGIAQYPVTMLFPPTAYEFSPVPEVGTKSNRELLDKMISALLKDGKDVLIRDVSYLGLPSCHVIIPGMSEILPIEDKTARVVSTIGQVVVILKRLGHASEEELKLVRIYEDYVKYSHYDNMLPAQYGVPLSYPFPGDQLSLGGMYLSAMICYRLGDYKGACDRIGEFNRVNIAAGIDNPQYYRFIEEYFKGKRRGYSHEEIMGVLQLFFTEDICLQGGKILKDRMQVLGLQYPHIEPYQCKDCAIEAYCHYDIVEKLQKALMERQREYFPSQKALREFFLPALSADSRNVIGVETP